MLEVKERNMMTGGGRMKSVLNKNQMLSDKQTDRASSQNWSFNIFKQE